MSTTKRRAVDMMAMSADHDHTAGYVPSAAAVVPVVSVEELVPIASRQDLHEEQAQQAVGGAEEDHQQVLQHEQKEIVPRKSGRVRRASVVRQPPGEANQKHNSSSAPTPRVKTARAKGNVSAATATLARETEAKGKERARLKKRGNEESSESSSEKDVLVVAKPKELRARHEGKKAEVEEEEEEEEKQDDRDDSSANGSVASTTRHAIRDKDLCDLTKAQGMQSQRAARAIVRGTFPFAKQRVLALAVFLAAIESARQNGRKRVMLKKDVEPALLAAKGVISALQSLERNGTDGRKRGDRRDDKKDVIWEKKGI